jgi:hypothetical protein
MGVAEEETPARTQATARGHKEIRAHVRVWDLGVRIVASIEDDRDGGPDADAFSYTRERGSARHRARLSTQVRAIRAPSIPGL